MRWKGLIICSLFALVVGGIPRYVYSSDPRIIKGDGVELKIRSNGDETIITSGWPHRMGDAKPCSLKVDQISSDKIIFSDSDALMNMGGGMAFVTHGGGIGIPLIAMAKPEDSTGFVVDAIGCEWQFAKEMNFEIKGIRFKAKPNSTIKFGKDEITLHNVEISGR